MDTSESSFSLPSFTSFEEKKSTRKRLFVQSSTDIPYDLATLPNAGSIEEVEISSSAALSHDRLTTLLRHLPQLKRLRVENLQRYAWPEDLKLPHLRSLDCKKTDGDLVRFAIIPDTIGHVKNLRVKYLSPDTHLALLEKEFSGNPPRLFLDIANISNERRRNELAQRSNIVHNWILEDRDPNKNGGGKLLKKDQKNNTPPFPGPTCDQIRIFTNYLTFSNSNNHTIENIIAQSEKKRKQLQRTFLSTYFSQIDQNLDPEQSEAWRHFSPSLWDVFAPSHTTNTFSRKVPHTLKFSPPFSLDDKGEAIPELPISFAHPFTTHTDIRTIDFSDINLSRWKDGLFFKNNIPMLPWLTDINLQNCQLQNFFPPGNSTRSEDPLQSSRKQDSS